MKKHHKMAAVLAALSSLALTAPAAQAQTATVAEAEKLRQLDIMLMVSSLRCRFGPDNFQADYELFSAAQQGTMTAAYGALNADYTARLGTAGAKKALDSVSVSMANQYGQGHPWLGCGELKAMTHELASTADQGLLLAVANDVLSETAPSLQLARLGQ